MTKSYQEVRQEALEALERSDPQTAFRTFRHVLEYPGQVAEEDRWPDALDVFARIGGAIAGEEFAGFVRRAAANPDEVQFLYDLGYHLIEHALNGIAATVLARAHRLESHDEAILTELVAALEGHMRYDEARRVLSEAPEVLSRSDLCRYLLAFNCVMTGDLAEPRRLLPRLRRNKDPNLVVMTERIEGMLRRAEALRGVSPLDDRDLRGWHFVITGGLLLHLSPYGLDDPMRGRYAFVQDSVERCHEGILRLSAVLDAWDVRPPRVFALADRESAILAHAAGRWLCIPVEPWPAEGAERPGLVVAYDLHELPADVVATLQAHRPGLVLWAQASCWTRDLPFAADTTTYLYQFNTSPWAPHMRVNPETNKTEETPPREGSIEDLAAEVVQSQTEPGTLDDVPALVALARAAAGVEGEHGPGGLRSDGNRRRQWSGSPVPSNRFID